MATERAVGSDSAALPRDVDRTAVYEAEDLVHRLMDRSVDSPTLQVAGSTIALPGERKFASLESVQRYVDAVLALPRIRAEHPQRVSAPVAVRRRRGNTQAHYEFDSATLALPTGLGSAGWAMRELVVLHELAHHLSGVTVARHGPQFRHTLLDLIDAALGPEVRLLLYVTYADVGISPVL